MANTIITKNNSTPANVPAAGELVEGELAINTADKKLYSKTASAVFQVFDGVYDSGTVSGTGTDKFIAVWNGTADINASASFDIASAVDKTASEVVSGAWSVPSLINGKTASYTLILGDAGKTVRFTGATASKVCTVPAFGGVAFPVGTMIGITNDGTVTMTVAITTDTMTWGKDNTAGTRTLAAGADCVIHKVSSTSGSMWKINGSALVT